MSLKRSDIKAIFPEATTEQVQSLIDKHTETVEALQEQIETEKEKSKEIDEIKIQLEEETKKYNSDIETAKKALEDYKNEIGNKETITKKKELYKAELKSANISDVAIEKAMKMTDFNSIELEGGKFKDIKAVQETIKNEWGAFAVVTEVMGASTANPPQTTTNTLSCEDIRKMTPEQINANWDNVSKALSQK